MTEPSAEQVTVSRAALDALIEYADEARSQRDREFCVGAAEYEASDAEFQALVDALGLPEEGG